MTLSKAARKQSLPQIIDSNATIKLADELTYARHSMTGNELKLWLITISSISSANLNINGFVQYQYDISKIADALKINTRKARKKMVRELFQSISDKKVRIMHRYHEDEDLQDWVEAHLYSSIDYSGSKDTISIAIDPNLLPYLTNLKEKFTEFEIQELTAIEGVVPIKVYLLVKELIKEHVYDIPIDKFKERLGMDSLYDKYNDFKRYVLSKSEKEIRKHTSMKSFHFFDDGGRGRKATTISFSLNQEDSVKPALPAKDVTKENVDELVEKLPVDQKSYYVKIMIAGVSSEKVAYSLVTDYEMDQVISGYEYYQEACARKPDKIKPGYLVKAIQLDYGKTKREEYLKKAERDKKIAMRNEQQTLNLNLDQLREECKDKAVHYVKTANIGTLMKVLDSSYMELNMMSINAGFPFDEERAKMLLQKRDLRYKEMTLFVELLADKIKTGSIIT